jgi:LacI family transcriptional regulator
MKARVTLSDVATRAGVHVTTASRALNPASRLLVNVATAQRVDRAAAELGYSPNALARGLRTQRSSTVGVLIPDLNNPLFPPMIRGIEAVLVAEGISTVIANTDNDATKEQQAFETLLSRQVDGFIFATAKRVDPFLRRAQVAGVRGVLISRATEEPLFRSVLADDDSGIAQILEHLHGQGHRSIAHIAGPENTSAGFERARAFRSACQEYGLSVESCPVAWGEAFSVGAGRASMATLLERSPGFTAVVAGNDLMAVGVMRELQRNGLRCPEDISVVGFNDTLLSADVGPGLTTVSVPLHEIGMQAARLILDESLTWDTRFPVTLKVRGSTVPPRDQTG